VLTAQSDTSHYFPSEVLGLGNVPTAFPSTVTVLVLQAHILGEVGILGIVLLRVYSGTALPIFIEIGPYLTDKEQKISWHSFSETRCTKIK